MSEQQSSVHEASTHEHLFHIAFGNKMTVRFCERCGQTWLLTQLQDLLSPRRTVYCWTEVLDEAAA